jgi:hypothetical protein
MRNVLIRQAVTGVALFMSAHSAGHSCVRFDAHQTGN